VQVYDGRHAVRPGHSAFEGVAIEAQGWPDAPNQPGFPSIDLAAGATCVQITEWRLGR
jgi:aldose 1-epimerase